MLAYGSKFAVMSNPLKKRKKGINLKFGGKIQRQ